MRYLLLGDPHAQISNLQESEILFSWALSIAKQKKVDKVLILGDLFHTHSVLRLEVIDFWTKTLKELAANLEIQILVGNHDMSGSHGADFHALSVFKEMRIPNLYIFDKPSCIGPFGYLPYIYDKEDFLSGAEGLIGLGSKTLFTHQTFDGSIFENGLFAPDGIDPNLVNCDLIISGHIHATQNFGKVWYPGTPRWLTASDANQPKGIWIVDFDDQGKITKKEFFSSEDVCEPIIELDYKEGSEMPAFSDTARVKINLIGSSDWISKQKKELLGKVSISTKITDRMNKEFRKTGNNFEEFVENHFKGSENPKKLIQYMKEHDLV